MASALRILYAEDNALDADLTRTHFSQFAPDFEMDIVGTGQACIDRLSETKYDVLLLDHRLPDMEGEDVLKSLVRIGAWIPTVLVTGSGDEDLVVRALRLGAVNYVPKTGGYLASLPELLRSAINAQSLNCDAGMAAVGPRRILYVEHLPMDIDLTRHRFAETSPQFELDVTHTCADALDRLEQSPAYDAALVDLRMPDQSGLDFVREARRRGLTLPPFIMISGKGDEEAAIASLKLGAADYVIKRENYLDQLPYVIDRAIAYDRLKQASAKIQVELAERKQTQDALEERRLFLNTLLDDIPLPVFYKNIEGQYLEFNQAFLEFFGKTREELIGKCVFDIVPQELAEIHHAKDLELLRAPCVQIYETKMMDGCGQLRNVVDHKATYIDSRGQIGGLVGAILDITDRKKAEGELQFRNAILSTQQESSLDGILVVNSKREMVSFNQRMLNMWGVAGNIMESRAETFVLDSIIDKLEDSQGFISKINYLYEHPEEKSEDEILLKDGKTFDRYSAPMRAADGTYLGRVWYFRDITARRRAEQEINEQLDELHRWHALSLGRENRILELKHEINELLARTGSPARYPTAKGDQGK
jgi:PAS domain S-box-containing protein